MPPSARTKLNVRAIVGNHHSVELTEFQSHSSVDVVAPSPRGVATGDHTERTVVLAGTTSPGGKDLYSSRDIVR